MIWKFVEEILSEKSFLVFGDAAVHSSIYHSLKKKIMFLM